MAIYSDCGGVNVTNKQKNHITYGIQTIGLLCEASGVVRPIQDPNDRTHSHRSSKEPAGGRGVAVEINTDSAC